MAHFAKVVNDLVERVIVAEVDFFEVFVDDTPGEWIQCSYNTSGGIHYNPETGEPDSGTPLRYNFPGPNYHYDRESDAFYAPQPYPSWTLNQTTFTWEAPKPMPNLTQDWVWDEETLDWIELLV